jgi:hypothetical protein
VLSRHGQSYFVTLTEAGFKSYLARGNHEESVGSPPLTRLVPLSAFQLGPHVSLQAKWITPSRTFWRPYAEKHGKTADYCVISTIIRD